jgi:hypothetical protein
MFLKKMCKRRNNEEEDVSNYWTTREKRRYWKLKEEALDHTIWRNQFGRDCGHKVAQNM